MAIDMVKIRAKITIGTLVVQTPYILSFSVNITRGNISTFNASLKVPYFEITGSLVGDSIKIEAGENNPSSTVFSGIVRKTTISPVFDDPTFVLMNMSGDDILSKLNGKKYTRRCRSTNTSWVTIDNITRQGLRTGKFRAKKSDYIDMVHTDELEKSSETKTRTFTDTFNEQSSKTPTTSPELIGGQAIIVPDYTEEEQ